MWLQAAAIVLPRVQQHYSVPDSYIGIVSSAMFAGMMIGAVGWGTCSDLLGRSTAFNATLFFTALFGILAGFSYSYPSLCVLLFLLGTAVGVSVHINFALRCLSFLCWYPTFHGSPFTRCRVIAAFSRTIT
jgi:MFS family permease